MDTDWIRKGLERTGKTQRGLAERLRLDPAAINRLLKGQRQLKASEIKVIEDYLEISPAPQRSTEMAPAFAETGNLPRDIPIHEGALCGEDGAFEFDSQVADYAPRPPRLRGVTGVYALYVHGDSMSPWREPGQLVYVNPAQPPRSGDYVVIQFRPKPGSPPESLIKRLTSITSREIKALQYNPQKTLAFNLSRIMAIHRVMEWEELLGA